MGVSDSHRRWAPVFAGVAGLCAEAGTVMLLAGRLVEDAVAHRCAMLSGARFRGVMYPIVVFYLVAVAVWHVSLWLLGSQGVR